MNDVARIFLALLAAISLLVCGACSAQWTFTQRRELERLPPVFDAPVCDQQAAFPRPTARTRSGWPPTEADSTECAAIFRLEDRAQAIFCETWHEIQEDHVNYYCCGKTLRDLGLGLAFAAPFANTSCDGDVQAWYQREVRSDDTDRLATFWKTFGEGQIFIPAFAGLALVGSLFEQQPLLGKTGEFGMRVTRSYLVGVPPVLFAQYCLGSSRPGEASVGSQWKPFDDLNAVSGHAFIGAVPWLTAAQMCDNGWTKCALCFCSTFTAWSRINDDHHYPTQACLGWWMAYLACRSTDQREADDCLSFAPLITPEMAGVGMVLRR